MTYSYDTTFFDIIDTESKAYVLGFFYADGYNYEKNNTISIRIIDHDILCDIRKAMGTNRPFHVISAIDRSTDGYNRSETYVFSLTGKHISETLAKQGCPQAKSKILEMPSTEIVPDHLMHHFVRGYFDGDGSVGYAKNTHRLTVDIIANRKFAEGLKEIIPCATRIRNRKYTQMSDIRIGKQADIRIFADWLYKDATIFLKRKRNKFLNLQSDPYAGTKRKNHAGDTKLYTFYHDEYGSFAGTRQEFMNHYKDQIYIGASGVSELIRLNKPYKGWRLLD